jgi:hypothetical protein
MGSAGRARGSEFGAADQKVGSRPGKNLGEAVGETIDLILAP